MSQELVATVDRIEQNEAGTELAVLVFDDGQELVIERVRFPWLQRGMVLRVRLEPDREEERRRREDIARLQERLFGESES